jgi:hypothetical protein
MHKYGILIYEYLSLYQTAFDVITTPWDAVEVWPTEAPLSVTDKNGQQQYQWPANVYFKIVESEVWEQPETDAIEGAVALWNENNPGRQIPPSLQLIFTPEEAPGIPSLFDNERARLINE